MLLVAADHLGEPVVLEAIKRAYAEKGIQARILCESEIVGISRDDALKIHGAKGQIPVTKEFGFGYFETEQSDDWSVNWFKKQQPDVAAKLFPAFAKDAANKVAKLQGLGKALAAYMDKHPEIDTVYYGRGGRQNRARQLAAHREKFRGILFSTITTS